MLLSKANLHSTSRQFGLLHFCCLIFVASYAPNSNYLTHQVETFSFGSCEEYVFLDSHLRFSLQQIWSGKDLPHDLADGSLFWQPVHTEVSYVSTDRGENIKWPYYVVKLCPLDVQQRQCFQRRTSVFRVHRRYWGPVFCRLVLLMHTS